MTTSVFRTPVILIVLFVNSAYGNTLSEQQIREVYQKWVHAIETAKGNPQPVVSLYAPKSVLLATLAAHPITTQQGMESYFAKLTSYTNLNDLQLEAGGLRNLGWKPMSF